MNKQDWTYKKLGEVAQFINGDRGRNYPSQNDFVESGIPFINAGHLNDGKIDFESMNYINEAKFNSLNSGKIKNGDILFCLRGSLGKRAIVNGLERGAIASSLVILRCETVLNQYLYYFLGSPVVYRHIQKSNNGSSQPNLSAKSVSNFVLPIPSSVIQSRIVAELDLLSGVIEKKKEQLKAYDQLAQSIFYSMFGDPIDNPKGWETKKLGKLGECVSGGTPSRRIEQNFKGTINWFSAGELNKMFLNDSIEKITKEALDNSNAKLCSANSLFIGMYDTAAFKLGIPLKESASNQACANVDLYVDNVIWLYYSLLLMREEALKYRHGARQKNLSLSFIKNFIVPVPPLSLQQEFAEKVEAIERQKAMVQQSIVETQTMFDYTMDKYFG